MVRSALLAYGYNLFNTDGLEVMQECEARGIAVHVAGAFMLGVFNTGSDTRAPPPGGSMPICCSHARSAASTRPPITLLRAQIEYSRPHLGV